MIDERLGKHSASTPSEEEPSECKCGKNDKDGRFADGGDEAERVPP
jgi:hypothetical protein